MSVLCYHAIDPDWESPLAVRPEDFEDQCRVIAESGGAAPAGLDTPAGRHVITFDDGFACLMKHALPSLRRYSLPSTLFVVAGTLAEQPAPVNWLRPPEDPAPQVLTAEEILEMADAGVTIASHSWEHRDLPEYTEQECLVDLRESRERLEDLIHAPVTMLAYPFGNHAPHVRRAAEQAGFELAYSLPEGREDVGPYAMPRVGIYRDNPMTTFRIKAAAPYLKFRMSRARQKARSLLHRNCA